MISTIRIYFKRQITLIKYSMGIDINMIREDKGGNPNLVRESLQKRFKDPAIVD